MRTRKSLTAVILVGMALQSAIAQDAVDLTGKYAVTESWSATLQVGTGRSIATKNFHGTETGTLSITNGVYALINRTAAPSLGNYPVSRTIDYNDYGGGYEIGGREIGITGGGGQFYVVVPLTFFVITIPLGSTGGFSIGNASLSTNFDSSGETLEDLTGLGSYVDGNAPDATAGYLNEIDYSSAAGLVLPPVAPTITQAPFSLAAEAGSGVSLSVGVSGTPPLTYKWTLGGARLSNNGEFSGTTTAALEINNVQAKDAGVYTVEVSNSKGSASASATLSVIASHAFTNLHNFTGGTDGWEPYGEIALSNNTIYATGYTGDAGFADGAVFALNAVNSQLASLHVFSPRASNSKGVETNSDGAFPGDVTLCGNALYGAARGGGSYGNGAVFTVNIDTGDFTNLHSFAATSTNSEGIETNSDGVYPAGALIASGETLYGATSLGGSGNGTLFALDTNGLNFTTLYTFTNGDDGSEPEGGMVLSGNTLFGTTLGGGTGGSGTVYALNLDNMELTNLYNFSALDTNNDNSDGAYPTSDLVLAGNALYGTALFGGASGNGTVYSIQTDGSGFTKLHDFSASIGPGGEFGEATNGDGANPNGGLALAQNALYGTTQDGGAWGDGTVFKVNMDGSNFTVLYTFTATDTNGENSDGAEPAAGLIVLSNALYGTANVGGSSGGGTIFSLSLANASAGPSAVNLETEGGGTITHGSWPENLVAGSSYEVTAIPKAGNLFVDWVGGATEPYSVLSTSPTFKFTNEPNLVLEAVFTTNVFLAAHGSYYGLFADTNGLRQQTNSGGFNFNLTGTGSFTGKLLLGPNSLVFDGKFGPTGSAQVVLSRKNKPSLMATLELDFTNQTFTGMVSDGGFESQLSGFRNEYSATNKATTYEGLYTLIIPGTNNPAVGPYGISYGTVTVSSLGAVSFKGGLADGTTGLAQSSAISSNGDWPLYLPLYGGKGSLWGWASISDHVVSALVSWINETNSSKTAEYRSGFTNQEATLTGSVYDSTIKPLFGFTAGQVVLEQLGSTPFLITNQVTISASDVITVARTLEATNKLSLKIAPNTGVLSGTFSNPLKTTQTITISGVLLQGATNAVGYFLGTDQSGRFTLENP